MAMSGAINISGGKTGTINTDGAVNISGGAVGRKFQSFGGSEVKLFGGEFRLDGVLVAGLGVDR